MLEQFHRPLAFPQLPGDLRQGEIHSEPHQDHRPLIGREVLQSLSHPLLDHHIAPLLLSRGGPRLL